jgi:hypothetical protein
MTLILKRQKYLLNNIIYLIKLEFDQCGSPWAQSSETAETGKARI